MAVMKEHRLVSWTDHQSGVRSTQDWRIDPLTDRHYKFLIITKSIHQNVHVGVTNAVNIYIFILCVNCNAFLVVANQLQELTTREHFGLSVSVCEPARRHCDHNKVSLHVVLVTPASNYLMPLSHCSHCSIDNNTCVCAHEFEVIYSRFREPQRAFM